MFVGNPDFIKTYAEAITDRFPGTKLRPFNGSFVLENSGTISRNALQSLFTQHHESFYPKVKKARDENGNWLIRLKSLSAPKIANNQTPPKQAKQDLFSYAQEAQQAQWNKEAIASLIKQAVARLPTSEGADIPSAIHTFIKESLRMDPRYFTIQANDERDGLSGDKVFRVLDASTQETLAIVKTYHQQSKNFFPEIFCFNFLSKAKIFGDRIKIYAIGKALVDQNPYFLVAEKVVPGENLRNLLRQPVQYPVGSEERKTAFSQACAAMQETGKSLARLHGIASTKPLPISEHSVQQLHYEMHKAIAKLDKCPQEGIDPQKVKAYAEHVIALNVAEKHSHHIVHWDAHPGNMFYDPETGHHTLIDFSPMGHTFNSKGEPLGMAARDYHKVCANIQVLKLIDAEKEKLQEVFQNAYLQGGGSLPTAVQYDYLFLFDELEVLGAQIDSPHKDQQWWKDRLVPILNRNLHDLKVRLADFDKLKR